MRIRPAHFNTCYLATLAIRILDLYNSSSKRLFGIGSELLTTRIPTGSQHQGNKNKSFGESSECAEGYDLGKVTVNVWVDNKLITQVKAEDLKTTNVINATELSTKGFNITTPENSNLAVDPPVTHLEATHGWYIFLEPLPVGEPTIRYVNDVRETTLRAGNTINADITYSLNDK